MPLTRGQSDNSTAMDSASSETVQTNLGENLQQRIEAAKVQLETQMKVTRHVDNSTQDLLESGNERKLLRQKINLEDKINVLHGLVTTLIELKFEEGLEETAINEWSEAPKRIIEDYEESLEAVETFLQKREDLKEEKKRDAIEAREEEKRIKALCEEEERQERQRKFDSEMEEKRLQRWKQEQQTAKLPKLEISKFKGNALDWNRFWEQFESEIDKSNKAAITKFSYLRELLTDRPRDEISGLPYTELGYQKAKEILKTKYGVTSEITQAHGRTILNLPVITSINLKQIHEFYRSLNVSVNSLRTLGKLDTAEILVRETLDKLRPIKADLTRTDPEWQNWGFQDLLKALRDYTLRNPEKEESTPKNDSYRKWRPEKNFQGTETYMKKPKCVYCDSTGHRSSECDKIKEVSERKEFLRKNNLCYNCSGTGHGATSCRSGNCRKCSGKHHTSICTAGAPQPSHYMIGAAEETIHPTVVVVAKGEKFRALLDTGAGSSFASSTFIKHLDMKPTRWENKSIETMTATVNQKMPVYEIKIESTDGEQSLDLKVNKLDRPVLTTFNNPRIGDLKRRYSHLQGIQFDNEDNKAKHPIHLILGAGDIARIKTTKCKIGESNQPIAERTTLGWTLMGPGEVDTTALYITRTSHDDYRQLYSLDVLGLQDEPEGNQEAIHTEFKEQLTRLPDGRYSTGLPWKAGHPPLLTNKVGSRARLDQLMRKLERKPDIMQKYHSIIQDQIDQGIVEQAPEKPTGEREYYLPHKPIIRESAETTKIRIVFDASAKESPNTPSLNECLHKGPPLQPQLHDVLVRNRFKPIGLTGDIKQAFHQIWVDTKDRDVLRFFWVKDLQAKEVVTLRQTRVPFGSAPSPFLLGGTLKEHLENYSNQYPDTVEELKKSTYVDDVITGGETEPQVCKFKEEAVELFKQGGFPLHKWHSSKPELEEQQSHDGNLTYAKEELGTTPTETKILGMKWNKSSDTLAVNFRDCKSTEEFTKRGMLRAMAKVYDPIGLISPVMLVAKGLYRQTCEASHTWDSPLQKEIEGSWKKWLTNLPEEVTVPRCITPFHEEFMGVTLHGFGDASGKGCSAAIYAVVHQKEKKTQGLVASKSRIAKKNVSIPRLELVSAHMVANLLDNVRKALEGYNMTGTHGWLDSTVALYWIKNRDSEWKQFVSNRVAKIQQKNVTWRHCPTTQNPADIGSRGATTTQLGYSWWNGPTWLAEEREWPKDITLKQSKEVNEEVKTTKQLQTITTKEADSMIGLLEKHNLWKVLRITAWMFRFVFNMTNKVKRNGVLTTSEINQAEKYWTRLAQKDAAKERDFKHVSTRLELAPDNQGSLRCGGRITGEHPVFLPSKHQFTTLVIEDAHTRTLHGGVGLTMAKVREKWWVEKLRKLVKSTVHRCNTCKRYRARPLPPPTPAKLPTFRTKGKRAFETVGVDFAGPMAYKVKKKVKGKCYVALYTCAASRAVHLDLLPDMTAEEFKRSLGEFIARRGKPARIVSDNGKTFVATAKWLKKLKRSQVLNDYLARSDICWQFNLSRSPWWGGFFERMVGLMKNALRKAVGQAHLSFKKLKEVLLDVEVTLNNRPLGYMEDDIQLQPLTPNGMLHGVNISLPEEDPEECEEKERMCKQARYIKRCKDIMWNRWSSEYVKSLREKHRHMRGEKAKISVGDIMIIKGDEKNRGIWKMGAVEKLITGKDGIVRGAVLKTENGRMERPLQHLYPMELSTTSDDQRQVKCMNPKASEFKPRATREAKTKAIKRIRQITSDTQEH